MAETGIPMTDKENFLVMQIRQNSLMLEVIQRRRVEEDLKQRFQAMERKVELLQQENEKLKSNNKQEADQ